MSAQVSTGRNITETEKALAAWVNTLDSANYNYLTYLLDGIADNVLLSFLCVLDGAMAVENGEERGHLETFHVGPDGHRTHLNGNGLEYTHDIYWAHYPYQRPPS